MRRVWLADLLGPLRYLGRCARCDRQFMSVNVYVWLQADGSKVCEVCHAERH